jgi:hypothetical protein
MELLIKIALSVWIFGMVASIGFQYWLAKSMHDHFND